MSCNCQQTKGQVVQTKARSIQPTTGTKASSSTQPRSALPATRYSGPTSVTAIGPVSGRQYKFAHNGVILQVDPRDQAALAKIPHLRQAIQSTSKAQARPAFLSFRYSGPTSVTATGATSGRQYKFAQTGAILQVDPRDKAALAKIPHLRQI
jgi:hypothetical protein